jgi:hypothetical protein
VSTESSSDLGIGNPLLLVGGSHIHLNALSVVKEADGSYLVGRRRSSEFVSLPAIGATVIAAFQSGHTVEESGLEASRLAGQDVDIMDFVHTLADLGFIADIDGVPASVPDSWVNSGADHEPALVTRLLFGRVAWVFYAAAALFCGCVLMLVPGMRPTFRALYFLPDPALSLVILTGLSIVLSAAHEESHVLAARAAGVQTRLRLSRRLYFPVFECDLSGLWAVPRRQRFSPLLAGMAFNITVLALCLVTEFMIGQVDYGGGSVAARLIPALVLMLLTGSAWQCLVFLRTDLYAVGVVAFRCVDLGGVTILTLKSYLGVLHAEGQEHLRHASVQDRTVARWFVWIYVGGMIWSVWFLIAYLIPGTLVLVVWSVHGLVHSRIDTRYFWEAAATAIVAGLPVVGVVAVYVFERTQRRLSRGRAAAVEGATHDAW